MEDDLTTTTYNGLVLYSAVHGPAVEAGGNPFVRRPNPVSMIQINSSFAVETDSGIMTAQPGDWLCYDATSGHVWPVKDSYKQAHYLPQEA